MSQRMGWRVSSLSAYVQAIVNGMDAAEGRRRLVLLLRRAVPIEEWRQRRADLGLPFVACQFTGA